MSIWATLGIPPTPDRAVIRRAYAKALRVTHPEDDAEGFKALRAAYEMALAYADNAAARDVATLVPDTDGVDDFADGPAFRTAPAYEHEPAEPGFRSGPADEPAPADADLFTERDAAIARINARLAALAQGLRGPWESDDAMLRETLAAILAEPALGEIALYGDVEAAVADLLAATLPRSDAILLEAATAFGWVGMLPGAASPPVAAVLERLDEWRLIASFDRPHHPLRPAWRSLTGPVRPYWLWRIAAFRPGLEQGVATLLGAHGPIAPGLGWSFKAAAVTRWERFLGRAHLTAGMFAAIPLALVLYLALGDAFGGAVPALQSPRDWGIAAALLASPLVPLLARWARLRWLRTPHPRWMADGWPAGLAAVVAGAMLLPDSRAALTILTVMTALAWAWMAVAGGTATGGAVWKRVLASVLPVILCGMFGGGWAVALIDPVHRAGLTLVAALGVTIMVGPLTQGASLLARVPRWRAYYAMPVVLAVAGMAYGAALLIGLDGALFYAAALTLMTGFVIVTAAQIAGVRGNLEYRALLLVKMLLVAAFIYTAIVWVEEKQTPDPVVTVPAERMT